MCLFVYFCLLYQGSRCGGSVEWFHPSGWSGSRAAPCWWPRRCFSGSCGWSSEGRPMCASPPGTAWGTRPPSPPPPCCRRGHASQSFLPVLLWRCREIRSPQPLMTAAVVSSHADKKRNSFLYLRWPSSVLCSVFSLFILCINR